MNFVKSSLKYKQVTISVLALFFIIGVYSLFNMPRREDPKITIKQALVIAYYPGANSTQVEEQLTKKLEQYLFQFEEINKDKTSSSSQDGLSVITVELTDRAKNPDVFWNKLRHQLIVARKLDLPNGVIGPIVNSDFGDTEAMIIGISGKNVGDAALKEYSEQLEEQLRTIPSVSKIKKSGDRSEQITVSFNSAQLAQYGIELTDVIKVLQSQNDIYPSGNLDAADAKISFYTKGYFTTQQQLADKIVGAAANGAVVRLKDIATLSRGYADAKTTIMVNGEHAMIVTIQMQEGNNIVQFGKQVTQKINAFKNAIPSNINITTIANQPQMVDENISHFLKEFCLAIVAVIIVVILLLPLRIAAVAATAIPMTIAVTLALMNVLGIELHQVSLASLIVVLGMVVDDAIVVADNYVELLDKGVTRWDAAWRSASDLVVPILVATITIIAAFMPMVLLSGVVGEFILALPITVTIALASSFIVAMVLTPILCYVFIKKGLHNPDEPPSKKRKKGDFLNKMQAGYDVLLDWCVRHPKLTVTSSLISVALAGLLYFYGIKQKFFPAAERNQFVMELWMPTGTTLETTEKAALKLEALVKNDKRVVSYATFVGTSAPRFYYNFAPEFPMSNYAEIMINTTSNATTEEMYAELFDTIAAVVPEGMPQVKLMQQGKPLKAPVEVKISGDDISALKKIGEQVTNILTTTKGSHLVRSDFREDSYGYDIELKPEAERLGFTTESIAKYVYLGFSGGTITTVHEGSNTVNVVFRLDEGERKDSKDLNNLYLSSPVTKAKVPLQQIAAIKPTWHTGRIMHSNGVKTLTIQSETTNDVLASQLLASIRPQINKLSLPPGITISYGGEYKNQKETFGEMIGVLIVSIILIFFILLFQFRNIKEVLIVMLTIPLSLFGALMGLYLTGNNFGFTAFVGLISLSGVVVRNAIILIDHTKELLKQDDIEMHMAAIEAGKRRLRPIFLTAMAAAIGVLPMIISGSQMWSPLASVIALGVVWSMIMALLTVPILYINWVLPKNNSVTFKTEG